LLFNSLPYLLFLVAATGILFLIPRKGQWLWLLLCSTFFYWTLLPLYLIVFFALILVNFYFGIRIADSESGKQRLFNVALIVNLILLAFFKYNGIIDSILASILSHENSGTFWKIILPIGLSYFVFTILSYLIEVKRGNVEAERHLGIFASSLLFFPKLLQGPIERPGRIFPQFRELKEFSYPGFIEGLKMMLWGYFKKLVVADRLAIYVNAVYGNPLQHNGTTFITATVFYAFQLYADFSGYTDIALGSAKIMGFDLTNNFRRPYFATSVREFWNRWHISFSTWLRDYVFLPLAYFFSRKMKKQAYASVATEKWIFLFSTMITFAICGIWHGEGMNFLVWGLLFGIFLSFANWTMGFDKQVRRKLNVSKKSIVFTLYSIIVTFLLVCFTFIFFRADSISGAFQVVGKIIFSHGPLFIGEWQQLILGICSILLLSSVEIYQEYSKRKLPYKSKFWLKDQLVYASLVMSIILFGVFDSGQFIYFKF
jgi:alginate O-acetyltransferase complex protein AlgI